jgi:hypothetical protein
MLVMWAFGEQWVWLKSVLMWTVHKGQIKCLSITRRRLNCKFRRSDGSPLCAPQHRRPRPWRRAASVRPARQHCTAGSNPPHKWANYHLALKVKTNGLPRRGVAGRAAAPPRPSRAVMGRGGGGSRSSSGRHLRGAPVAVLVGNGLDTATPRHGDVAV